MRDVRRFFATGLIVHFLVLLPGGLKAEPREFHSTDGKSITAEVLAIRGADVVLSISGREFTVPVNRLSEADQKYLEEWKKKDLENHVPKLRVDVNTGKSDRRDKADAFDDRTGSFQFTVKVTNQEIDFDLQGAKGELVVIGEDAENRDKYGIMQKSSFPVSAEPGKTFEWKGEAVHYRFDDRPPAYWGSSYGGYILRIKNATGKVIYQNAIPQSFEKHIDKILGMETLSGFDKNGEPRGTISILD